MADLHSLTEPYADGMLEVGDDNVVYWETCGNPDGKPALVVHGGPGSGCSVASRRYFDLNGRADARGRGGARLVGCGAVRRRCDGSQTRR